MVRRKLASLFFLVIALLILTACAAISTAVPTVTREVAPGVARIATATATATTVATPTAVTGNTKATATTSTRVTPTPITTDVTKSGQMVAGMAGDSVAEALTKNAAAHDTVTSAAVDTVKTTQMTLKGSAIQVNGGGVTVNGNTATITAAGTYSIHGSLDGQIVVETKDKEPVKLILNGVTLNNSSGAAIEVRDAKQVAIILADNSQNRIADGTSYASASPDDEPNAAIFSTADLTISGNGSLTVVGNYNDGIASKDGLVIAGGTITVTAADDGIRGKDYLVVKDGRITVNVKGDGLKADNAEDATKGYIFIENGTLTISSSGDALAAETDVLIMNGKLTLSSGGGYKARLGGDTSAKGIKGNVSVIIDGGSFAIDSADDTLHSNGSIVINNGTFVMATADDGMHADAAVKINGGDIHITNSYEGIESAVITINSGNIYIVSSDDGVNVSGGKDSSGMPQMPAFGARPGRGAGPGQDAFANTGSQFLYINGGYIVIDAAGDGIDANGAIAMTNGVVIVNGPTQQMNGALDHSGFTMTGGFLVAVGSSGMAQAPGTTSTQNALLLNFNTTLKAGTLIHIESSDGREVLTFAPTKQYQSIAFSSAGLAKGATYDVYTGGSSTGAVQDGLYQGGTYTGGSKYTSFTASSIVTMIGSRGR